MLLDVDVNKDSVGIQTVNGFAIDTKHVQTQVLVENGGTVVIGGIFVQTDSKSENKVPLLGDLPVVGHLFKNTSLTSNKSELLIFLTPKVVSERSAWHRQQNIWVGSLSCHALRSRPHGAQWPRLASRK